MAILNGQNNMEHDPLVTIGILSYNRPKDLRQAILSVINQSYANLEILLSDNGSDIDETRQIIREFEKADTRIRPFFHKQNSGPLFNFEFLVNNASGTYFAWLADDDFLAPSFVEDCVGYFATHPSCVLTASMPFDAQTGEMIDFKFLPTTAGLNQIEKYRLVTRYIFNDLNLFYYGLIEVASLKKCKFYLKKVFSSDTLLLPELLNSGDIFININRKGFGYRIHDNQTSSSLLRYKTISTIGANTLEKRFFFSSFFFYLLRIVSMSRKLSVFNKINVISYVISHYLSSKRYHLIKYDLGINGLIQKFKK